ncbi:MAG: DUF7507 domain-containing protein [Methanosarcina sp.]
MPFGAQAEDNSNFTNTADVSVVVTDSPDPVYQGQNITYDIVVKNNSPDTAANGVVVTDTICPNAYFVSASGAPYTAYANDIIFQVGTLSPGQSLVIKMVTKVSGTAATDNIPSTNPDIGTTGPKPEVFDMCNIAKITATTGDSNTANNSYYQMTNVLPAVNSNPSYKIDKTVVDVAGQGPLGNVTTVGDVITYQIKVSNNGDVNLTNVNVTDSLINLTGPAESVNADGVLQIGEKWEYTGRYTATQQDISTNGGGNQLIENTATVDCDQLAPKSDFAEVPFRGLKAFIVDKTVLDVAGQGPSGNISAAGEIIQYQIRVTNVGNADLMNVQASDSLVSLEKPEESLNTNGVLEIGETWVYTAYYTVTQTDISTNGGGDQIIENTAAIVCDELGPKTATTEVPLKGLPAYIIQKNVVDVAGKGPKGTATRAGNIITYEIIVRNVGNIGLTNVSVSDSLLGVLKNHTESMSENEIMEDEETWTYTGFYNVTSEDIRTNGGGDKLINNIATVNCDQLPAKFDNADAPVGSPSYILDKLVTDVAGRGPAGNVTQVGDVISYLITIRNTGNVNLTKIAINDSLTNLTGPLESKIADGILNKQENWNYTGNYTVTQDDINTNGGGDKLIENKVTVVCEELDPRSKSDTVEVPLEVPSYIIDKSVFDIAGNGPTGNITKTGDKISYKICVRNVGTIDLTNISVKDSLISLTGPNELLSANGVLNVGENWTYTGNYTVTQQDLNTNGGGNQLIENTATVDCDQLEPKSDIAEVPIKGAPAYIIEKTVTDVAGKGPSEKLRRAGDRISYQIVINNTGNIDLTNLTLSDPLISLSSPVESQNAGRILEVGENWVYTGTYNVTQEDINNNGKGKGLINNTATVDCYQLDAMQDSAEVLIERNPACSVEKVVTDVAGKGPVGTITTAGDIASYKISVNNTGNVDLTNVTVSDSLIKLTAPLESLNKNGILEVGEIWTYNSSYNVTQTDINNNGNANGSLENTVTVSSDQLGPITDKANVPILRLPDYNIDKTAIDIAGKGPAAEVTKAGEIVSYFITLNNTGNVELTNVSVVDSLISLTGPVESKTPDRILEVGETWNYTGNYTVTQIDLNNNGTRNGIIENKATADCDQLEPLFDTAAVPLSRDPYYTLDKAVIDVAGKGPAGNAAKAGDIIEYSVLVNNTGNVELTNVSLTDSLIKLMGPIESGKNNGILEVGEKWNYTGNYTVTQEDLNNNFGGSKSIKNTAVIDCDQLDPESDFAEVKLEILPACTIDKRISDVAGRGADGLIRKAGDVISYQINVSNKGNIDLTNTSVTDSLINLTAPDESKTANGILEVGENWSYAATYKVTQRDLNNNGNKNGSIENTATIDSDQLEPQNDSAIAFLERKLDYSLNKTVKDVGGKGPEGIVRKAGQVIAYQVKVENSGNVDLTNITISDSLTNLSGPIESKNPDRTLEVEENWTYTGNYTATQADLNSNGNGNEKIENTATVDCAQLDPLVSSAEVLIERNPACTIEKSVINVAGKGPAANVTKAGERISYSIIVNNTGNVDLTNVSTEDSLINLSVPFESKIANGILKVGEAWNYTGDYIVSQADMNTNADGHGFINNTATVDSDQLEPQDDSAGVPLLRLPDYTLDKTVIDVAGKGQQGAVTKAGERISYSIIVNNTGNVDLTNVTVVDSLTTLTGPVESKNPDGILEADEIWNYAGSYAATQKDINGNGNGDGFIDNTATVDCEQLDPKTDTAKVPVTSLPGYSIDKTVTDVAGKGPGANVTRAGEEISYSIFLNNTGNVELTNITIDDSLIDLAEPLESLKKDRILEVGEMWICTGNYTVTQENINTNNDGKGSIENTASVDCDQLNPKSDNTTVLLKQLPDYFINKTVIDIGGRGAAANITAAGDIIHYQVNVSNSGNLDLTNVTVVDSLITLTGLGESKNSDLVLQVGEVWTFSGNYSVSQADLNLNGNGNAGGFIENIATVDSDQLEPRSSTAKVPIQQLPAYTIDKNVTDVAGKGSTANITKAGDLVIYRINVTNSGNIDLTNVNVSDSLINLTGPTESKIPDRILEVGENWIFTGNYSVTQADINSNGNGDGEIENIATVDCDKLESKSDKENVSITQSPEYVVTKIVMDVAGKGPEANVTKAGQRISYSIIVNNTGNTELTNVSAFDSLINLTGPKESKIANRILEVGENWAYNGNYSVTQKDMNSNGDGNGKIENVVKVDCDQLEEKSDTAEVPLKSMPDYNIDKIVTDVAGKGPFAKVTKAGDAVNYQITVSNTGNLDLTNITVSDSLISLTSPLESLTTNGILEVGEIWSYTGNYTATQADINSNGGGNGFIENKATIDCDQLDPKSDEENVSITQDAGYTIEKMITDIAGKGPTANITRADDVLTYQINVTNTGNVDLTNVTLTDSLINLTEPLESLNVDGILGAGETWLFNGNYTVKQMDINTNGAGNGKIENTATVDCDQLDPKSDSANASIELLPDYVIDKIVIDVAGKGASANVTKAGDLITYRININNNGNSVLTNVTVNDSLVNLTRYVESKTTNGILEVGENWTYNASYIVKQADINSNGNGDGLIENIVTVDCDQLEPESDNESVAIAQNANYTIEKTVIDVAGNEPTANITKTGDLVTYQINVSNAGNTELTNINVTDSLIKLNGPAESANADRVLEVGEVWTYTGTYTVTQTDINSRGNGDGVINNTATVDCDQLDPKTDDAQVQIDNKSAYSIDKKVLDIAGKGQSANITKTGEIIGYSAVVHNEGNVDLTNVTVQDSLIKLIGPFESKTTDKILEVGENWTYNGNYSVTQQDINTNGNGSGFINNIVTVDSDQLEPERDNESVPLTQNVQYTIDKTIIDVAGKGQNEAVTKAGDLVSYLINVNNTGNVDLANLNVTDSLIKLIGPIESQSPNRVLQAGESWTYIGTYSATQRDINTNGGGDGFINNTATVESDLLDPKSDSEAVSVLQNPNYTIDKKVTDIAGKGQQGIVTKAGEIIGYSMLVSNTGNTDLTNVTVNDSLISLTEPVESKTPDRILEVGETWNYTGNYSVTQEDINTRGNGSGSIRNTATVDCDQLNPISDSKNVSITQSPEYTVDKTIIDVAGKGPQGFVTKAGEKIGYSIVIKNTGNSDLTNVTVFDSLINITGPTESKTSDKILEVGEIWNYSGNYVVTQTDINNNGNHNGSIENKVTIDCDQLGPKSDIAAVLLKGALDYIIEKSVIDVAGRGPFANVTAAGEIINYRINITNSGNIDFTNITVTDSLIKLNRPVESVNSDGILQAGESWIYTGNYTVAQEDINSNGNGDGFIDNTATVDCDQMEPRTDTAKVPVTGLPNYNIEKTVLDVAGKGPTANITKAGERISYSILVNNTGNSDLTNVNITDSLITLSGLTESKTANKILEVGEFWSYTGNYTVTQTDINNNGKGNGQGNGLISNTATVDCAQLEPESDTAEVALKAAAEYNINKTVMDVSGKGPLGNVTKAGDVIKYQIGVTNSGNSDLTNITVIDSLINLTGPVESKNSDRILEVEETWNYTGNYTVTQEDINNNGNGTGFVKNTAAVDCDQLGPKSDNKTVPIAQNPDYAIDKTVLDVSGRGPSGNIRKAGDVVNYSVIINNTGNSDLTNVTVTDSLISLIGPWESVNKNGILEVGETWSYTGNLTVTQKDINMMLEGYVGIYNRATVDCDQLNPESDGVNVPVLTNPDYTIDKKVLDIAGRGPTANVTKAGEVISYSVVVNNTGNIDLTNAKIVDSLTELTGPVESKTNDKILEIEETWNYTGNYTVTQADLNSNESGEKLIENNATVDCDQLDPKSDKVQTLINASPAYNINKTVVDVAGKGPSTNVTAAGDKIVYRINVTNAGNIDLTNVTVIDSLIDLTGPVESKNPDRILETEEIWTYSGNYTATQADINTNGNGSGLIENIVTVDSDQLDPKSDSENVSIAQNAGYTIEKIPTNVAGRGPAANITSAGEIISYQISVNNTGNIDLTNVTVADSLIKLSGPIESKVGNQILEVGETWNYTGNYTVKQADINANGGGDGFIDNTVTVKSDQLEEKSDTAKVPLSGTADFTINKKVTDIAGKGPSARVTKAGEKITYQVIVTNSGNIDLTNVSVTDSLINLTSPDESLTADGILEVGENWTYEGNYTVTQADINTNGGGNGFIENTATVSCDQLTPKSDSEDVSLSRKLDYSIDKIVVDVGGKGPIGKATKAGEKITYSIIVTNEGNANLANVTVVDSLTNLGEPLESWTKNKILEVEEFWIFESKYTVTQNDINTNGNGDGFIENTVQVYCDKLEPKSKTAKVPVKNSPAYTIDKKIVNIAGKGLRSNITKAGEVIEYSVIVNNTGNVELTNTTVFDSLTTLEGPIESQNSDRVLEVGESWNYNGNYTVTQLDINSNGSETGFIKNTATVDSDQLDPKTDEADVPIAQSAACTIDKKAVNIAGKGPSGNVTKAGDIISYQINVSNTGNTELTNITVSDSLISLRGPVESLNANEILEIGENWTYTGNYTVTQQDINSNGNGDGFIENTAAVRSDQLKEISVTVKVPLEPISVCLVDKTVIDVAGKGPTGNVTAVGEVISYQVNVTNTGNIDLTNITISDSLAELRGPIESKNPDRILETEEIWTYTGNYTITQADINNNGNRNGFIENIVTVDSDQLEPKTDNETVPVSYKPAYSINKKATDVAGKGKTGNVTKAGEIISYQINVINEGNIELTNITVIDPLITLTRPLESLNADEILEIGEIWTYSGNYTTTQKDLDNNGNGKGFIENIATVDCDQLEPKTDTETVPITQNFSYLIEKRVTQIDAKGNKVIDSAGDTVDYEIEVINQGNINLTNVTVTDSLIYLTAPRESKTADLILEIGESWIYTGTYTVNQADIDSNGEGDGLIENLVTVSCDQLAPKSNEAKVPIIQDPALNIDKLASPENYSAAGQIITYTYNITNIGNMNVTPPITVTDNKIGTINVTGRSLIPGQSVLVNTTYRITQADLDAGSVTNSAYATGNLRNNTTTSNTDSETVTSIQNPGLLIDKSASPSNYSSVGDLITYTYNVTNKGNVNITGPIKITDNRTGTINVTGNLMPGQSVQINNTYSITQADIDSGSITNSAFATGKFGNNTTASNTDNETVISEQKPALLINKSADPAIYSAVGDIITYTYNISNIGNVNITGPLTVTDDKIGTIQATNENLRPGQNILANATYIITQTDIDAGFVTNSALATGIFGNNTTTSNTDNETVTPTQNPKLEVEKSGFPANYSFVGQIITYTYNVTNTGNVIIAGPIEVTDNKTGIIIATAGNLVPGQTVTGTSNYTITQEDLNSGSVTNSAFANGTFNGNNITSEPDDETVIAKQNPALGIGKSASPINYSVVGQIITYTYNVTNTGNVNITGPITVTDDRVGTVPVTNGNLNPGQNVSGTANYTITQADLDWGSVTNSAFATGTFGNNTTISNTDNETVTGDNIPALLINKTADPKTYDSAGDLITYTYNITNVGNVNIAGPITVIDDKIGTVSIADRNLVPGQSMFANATYIITQADLDRGFVTNSAYAAGTSRNKNTTSNTDNETVKAVQNASYEIKKIVTDAAGRGSSSNVANAGDVIGYQINVTNNGNINLTNVTVEDALLENLNGPAESLSFDNVFEAGEIWTYTGNYTVTQQDIDSNGNGDGIIDNTATVKSDQLDPESDSVQVPIEGKPGYIIEKTVTNVAGKGPDGAVTKAGESITYQINVTNTGNINLTNISLNDTLITIPDLIESQNNNKVLEVGEIWTYTGNYTVTQKDLNINGNGTGFIENIATVRCDQLEPKKDSALVSIDQNPMHIIEKTITDVAGKGPLTNVTEAGDIITYQINISNTGNVDFTNVTVTDSLITLEGPAESLNPDKVLQVGENWIYTGNYTVTQEDINSNGNGTGLINNTVTVDCDQAEPSSDDAQVPIQNKPGYILDKIVTDVAGNGPFANVTKAGEIISYQITVKNTGNVNLTNVILNDPLIAVLDPIESLNTNRVLEVGENWTYRGNYIVTQADIENNEAGDRFIENTATVDCDQLEPVSDFAQVTVEKQQKKKPGYIIEKTVTDVAGKGSDGKVTKPGDLIVYQINVTNTGNVNLTNITLEDPLITVSGPIESLDINGVLEIGETWTYTGTYTVTQADIDSNGDGNGFVNNTATVDCDQLEPNSDSEAVAVERNTDYIIEKSILDVTGKGPAGNVTSAGEIISYQIAVKNTGNVDLTNVSVTDSLISLIGPTGDKEPVGILNIGENWVYTGNYTVTQADIETNGEGDGFIDNVAIVDCDQSDSKSDSESVEIARKIKLPDYLIQKSIIGVDKAGDGIINAPEDTIEYQVIVKNTGEINLTNVSVVDSLITLTGPRESITADMILEIGENWVLTGNYTVTQADINSNGGGDGFIDNTARVSCNELPIKSSTARQPILYKPAYNIYKSIVGIDEAGDCIINKPGDIIEYIIAVKNEGNVDLTDISVQDTLITSLTGPIGDDIDPGVLNPGETWKYTGKYTVTEEDINSNGNGDGFIENAAIVSSKELPEKSSVAAQPIIQKTDLCIYKCINGADKAGDCVINKPGEIIEYEIVVKNSGRTDLTGVLVNDPMLTLTGPTGDNIMPGILNPGEIWKYTGIYTVTQEDINSNGGGDEFIENTVTVHTNEAPEEKSSARQAIAQKSDYCIYKSVTKIDEDGDCIINKPGDKIEYCIVVKNEGNSDLTGILIKDTLINLTGPDGDDLDPGVLNPGETWKYSGTYTITEQDIKTNGNGNGFIENTATVSCNELSPRDSTIKQAIVSPSSETGTDSNPIIIPGNEKDKNSNPDGSTGGNNNNGNGNDGNGGGSSGGNSRKSSGSSSGGGAGGSPEPAKNVETKEIAQAFVTNGKAVKFEFINNATCVVYVSFDAKKTAGKVTTIVEMLKGKSALVPELPAGETYKSFNVWVGNEGFATAKNIDNAIVCFRVDKAWVEENKINKSTIILNRYNKQWEQLSTSPSGEDDKFLYFVAETSEFGSFAITAEKYQIPDSNIKNNNLNSSESKEVPEEKTINESANEETSNKDSDANREEKSMSGFELLCGVAGVSAAFLYKRR